LLCKTLRFGINGEINALSLAFRQSNINLKADLTATMGDGIGFRAIGTFILFHVPSVMQSQA
jgi:hypothetical protein